MSLADDDNNDKALMPRKGNGKRTAEMALASDTGVVTTKESATKTQCKGCMDLLAFPEEVLQRVLQWVICNDSTMAIALMQTCHRFKALVMDTQTLRALHWFDEHSNTQLLFEEFMALYAHTVGRVDYFRLVTQATRGPTAPIRLSFSTRLIDAHSLLAVACHRHDDNMLKLLLDARLDGEVQGLPNYPLTQESKDIATHNVMFSVLHTCNELDHTVMRVLSAKYDMHERAYLYFLCTWCCSQEHLTLLHAHFQPDIIAAYLTCYSTACVATFRRLLHSRCISPVCHPGLRREAHVYCLRHALAASMIHALDNIDEVDPDATVVRSLSQNWRTRIFTGYITALLEESNHAHTHHTALLKAICQRLSAEHRGYVARSEAIAKTLHDMFDLGRAARRGQRFHPDLAVCDLLTMLFDFAMFPLESEITSKFLACIGQYPFTAAALPLVVHLRTHLSTLLRPFTINVKNQHNTVVELDSVCAASTIYEVKYAIETKTSMPLEQQRLIYQSKALADEKTLVFYSIGEGALVHLVAGLTGD